MDIFKNLFKRKQGHETLTPKLEFASPIAKRLAEEFGLLLEIESERELRSDPSYLRATEERIIWRELFDLELQEADDEIGRHLPE